MLADPRITTISGRTATIRAGDNIAILTTTGGGTGTVATTQLQTFQTGVTLDITPVVNAGNFITVALHPTVNSLAGISNGIPQIATRDTQTTVAMREDETLDHRRPHPGHDDALRHEDPAARRSAACSGARSATRR